MGIKSIERHRKGEQDVMIERKKKRAAKIGVFAVAHAVYWEQFPGLEDNILK